MNILLKLESISKNYSEEAGLNINILEDINFEIGAAETGTITSILAPFGSGKSTLLKIISGLIEPSKGKIFYYDAERGKKIPYIPEKPSSFPWLNVRENIELVLGLSEDKKFNLNQIISLVGLTGYEEHFPHNKSTGFRFRISLARALALNPVLILIDDAFKLMKKESKSEIYDLLTDLSSNKKQSFVLATTNLIETVRLSDKIILMSKKPGKIIKEIKINKDDKPALNDNKSEIFTTIKSEIETSFQAVESLTMINYSV